MSPALPPNHLPKGILLWTAAGVAFLAVFFVLTFPFDALQARVLAEVERNTGLDVRAGQWTVRFPATLEWRDIELSKPEFGPIRLDAMRARIGLLKLLLGGVALDLHVRQPGSSSDDRGLAEVKVSADSWSFEGPLTVKGRLQQIDLSQVAKPYVSRGVAQGEFAQRWDGAPSTDGTPKGHGAWKLEARDVVLEHIPAGTTILPSLAFAQAVASLECRDSVCRVVELHGDGSDGSFTGEGQIRLQHPVEKSAVDLTVTVTPGPGFAAKASSLGLPPFPPGMPIKFKLTGPVTRVRPTLS